MKWDIELFHGPVTATESIMYAQVDLSESHGTHHAPLRLEGHLKGPINSRAETLPVHMRFHDAGPGETVLARVRVPDPCCWSIDLPSLYAYELKLLCGDHLLAEYRGVTGFRDLGAARASFLLNGERWVVRGKWMDRLLPAEAERLQTMRLTGVVGETPDDASLQECARVGAPVLLRLTAETWQAALRRIAAWPCVWGVILSELPETPIVWGGRSNVLIGCMADVNALARIGNGKDRGLDFVCVPVRDPLPRNSAWDAPGLPVIAMALGGQEGTARAACDQLQRRLTPANCAGYVVGWH